MCITVAWGAISGFRSTQSPLMARCMKSEKQGHFVFYGAMVSEGVIALIWACLLYTSGQQTGHTAVLAQGHDQACGTHCEHGTDHDQQHDREHTLSLIHI